MKSNQFCSVCKQWLEMEVVPTGDGDEDDGVVWYRCPKCQGFLPKLSSARDAETTPAPADAEDTTDAPLIPEAPAEPGDTDSPDPANADEDEDMPWDSPAEMLAASRAAEVLDPLEVAAELDLPLPLVGDDEIEATVAAVEPAAKPADETPAAKAAEPLAEYAAQLAALDPGTAVPYRPWATYEVGQCVQHLAWDDCGVVVDKESLPGGRQVIKCYFAEAGVVRLIEQAPQ